MRRGCEFHGGITDGRGLLVTCGKPLKPGYSYCREHAKRVWRLLNQAPRRGVRSKAAMVLADEMNAAPDDSDED